MGKKAEDLTGHRFGRIVVEARDFSYKKAAYWICKCDCGNSTTVQSTHLRNGATQSCGCLNKENVRKRQTAHGSSRSRLYRTWQSMKDRCYREKHRQYKNYGGRGITVCDEWRDNYAAFEEWAIANGYHDDLTIERIEVNGNYEPSNCKWATNKEQQNNRRNNHFLSYAGKTQTIAQWAGETGLDWMVIYDRVRNGWPTERILTEPLNKP